MITKFAEVKQLIQDIDVYFFNHKVPPHVEEALKNAQQVLKVYTYNSSFVPI